MVALSNTGGLLMGTSHSILLTVGLLTFAAAARAEEVSSKPILYVLAAQIDTHVLEKGQTPNSREARLLAKLATERSGKFYEKVETRVLFGEQASRTNILDGFTWLEKSMRDQDVALVFIAGHGGYDDKRHLYTYHPVGAQIKGIEFRQAFNKIPGCKVLLLQTCHANGVLETATGELPFRKTMVICACDDDETATRLMGIVMVNGLAKNAANADGSITTESLAEWIKLRVPILSHEKQHVQISKPPRFADFPLVEQGELVDPKLTGQF